MNTSTYPVRVDATLDPHLSRWLWLVKWLLAIPHFIVLAFLWLAFLLLTFLAFFAILFTGRYPRSFFEFNVGVLRWGWRVGYYASGALATDRYPPFSLREDPDYPAHLEVDYPERLSRGLVLVKWWLLAIPHYVIVGIFLTGAGYAVTSTDNGEITTQTWGMSLIGVLVLVAAVTLLFTGRYPASLFDLVVGLNRWVLRVTAYAALMTDEYPPFRLDQGGSEPAPEQLPAVDTAMAPAAAAPPTHPWTAGRIISLVVGCLVLFGALGVGAAGGALAFADNTLRDDDGFLMSGERTLTTDTYALVSPNLQVDADVPGEYLPHALLGDAKVTATGNTDAPVFIGVAATSDVDAFLAGTLRDTVVDLDTRTRYRTDGTTPPPTLPGSSDIWVAQASGAGTQEVTWPVEKGDWTLVVMNADGARGITADVAAGATVPAIDWLVPTLLVLAALGLLIAVLFIAFALRPHRS